MSWNEAAVADKTSALSADIYPHLQQMRHSFDEIIRILKSDERRVRHDWEMVQRERDRIVRILSTIDYDHPQPLPSSTVTPVAQRVAAPLSGFEAPCTRTAGICSPPSHQQQQQNHHLCTSVHSKGLGSDLPNTFSSLDDQWRSRAVDSQPYAFGAADVSGKRRISGLNSSGGRSHPRVAPPSPGPMPKRTFWIHVWPCFGAFTGSDAAVARPVRLVVPGNYIYMEQLTERAGAATGCRPAPSVLYEPDGRPVRTIAQLMPKQHYLLFPSGGFYRREAVPVVLLEELVRAAKSTLARKNMT